MTYAYDEYLKHIMGERRCGLGRNKKKIKNDQIMVKSEVGYRSHLEKKNFTNFGIKKFQKEF